MMNDNIMIKASLKPDRKVSYALTEATVFHIESRADFSPKEIFQSWYSQAEMRSIQFRCSRDAARLMDKSKRRPLCSRGLEDLTETGKEALLVAVQTCINAVMDEQESQWADGYDDYDRLAVESQQVTKQNTQKAIERAIQDAKAATKIYRKELQKKRMSPPVLPKRKESRDNLRKAAQDKISPVFVPMGVNLLEQGPDLFTLMEGRKRSIKDTSIMHVDLDTCKRFRNDDLPMELISPVRAKAA